jgi:phosphotransferase system HPr-like phosphotransfer protein
VTSANGTTDLSGILELLALGLQCGDEVTLQVSGGNEAEALETMSALFAKEFDFPDA